MLTTIFSKPVFRLSVVILVNENLLRVAPLVSKETSQRKYARWSARKPSKAFTPEDISSGSLETEEFYKSDYSESESLKKESTTTHVNLRKRDDNARKKNLKEYDSPKYDYTDDEHFEKKSHKHDSLRKRDDYDHGKAPEEYHRPEYDYPDDGHYEKKGDKRRERKRFDDQPRKRIRSIGGFEYEVLGENDLTFSKIMTQVGNRNMRKKNGLMMLEGKRLNLDALEAGLQPSKLFFTRETFLDELNLPADTKVPLFRLPYTVNKLWSKLETPPGIVGFYPIPKKGQVGTVDAIPVKVVCDNVRDPGNMGSIIRVAAGVGCQEIFLMKGCTDPWDSKVLRTASGGHFHIPIQMDLLWDEFNYILDPVDLVFLADSRVNRKPPFNRNLPQSLYHEVNYVPAHSVVVVIGGETEGLSSEAFNLALKYNGSRVNIPLSNCVESLNSGCALSVILFEIKKQIMLSQNAHNRIQPVHNEEEKVEERSSGSGG